MKLSSNILKICVLSGLILILSCGKKRSPLPYTGYIPPSVAQYPCANGRVDVIYSAGPQSSQNITQILGPFQPTPIGGNPTTRYIGVNLKTKDLIVVTKMTLGGTVLGFNIALSLCRQFVQYSNINLPLIDFTRPPIIKGSSPIIVSAPTGCSEGTVDQATVFLEMPYYQVPGTTIFDPITPINISFTRAECN